MPLHPLDTRRAYCARCQNPTDEHAAKCDSCSTPFVGSGAFDIIRGPRPSSLFAELFTLRPAIAQGH